MRKVVLLVTAICFCWMFTARAVVLSSLYSVNIPVKTNSAAERNKIIPDAFKTILIRVTGNSQIANQSGIRDLLKNANRYVSEYSYSKATDKKAPLPYLLNIDFIESSVNAALKAAGFSVWSKTRPLTLVWLVVKDQNGLKLIGDDAHSPVVQAVQTTAKLQGLPILFPQLDINDLRNVTASDVWKPSMDFINLVSQRYLKDDILVVAIDLSNDNSIHGRWYLYSNEQQMQWETDGDNVEQIINMGINNIVDVLLKQFTPQAQSNSSMMVKVIIMNLKDVTDYVKMTHYLKKLSSVTNVEVLNVLPTEADFNVTINGDLETLQRTIQLNSMLQPVVTNGLDDQVQPLLKYKYQPKN